MITGFIVFNLIIAVVCDAVAVIENKEGTSVAFWTCWSFSQALVTLLVFLDLEPDLFSAIESEDALADDAGSLTTERRRYEEEMIDQLADKMADAMSNQKQLLSTLESLAKESLVASNRYWARWTWKIKLMLSLTFDHWVLYSFVPKLTAGQFILLWPVEVYSKCGATQQCS